MNHCTRALCSLISKTCYIFSYDDILSCPGPALTHAVSLNDSETITLYLHAIRVVMISSYLCRSPFLSGSMTRLAVSCPSVCMATSPRASSPSALLPPRPPMPPRAPPTEPSTPAARPALPDDLLTMAVPKRKVSLYRRRLRRAGHRAQAPNSHIPYRTCGSCGSPVRMHYVCYHCVRSGRSSEDTINSPNP